MPKSRWPEPFFCALMYSTQYSVRVIHSPTHHTQDRTQRISGYRDRINCKLHFLLPVLLRLRLRLPQSYEDFKTWKELKPTKNLAPSVTSAEALQRTCKPTTNESNWWLGYRRSPKELPLAIRLRSSMEALLRLFSGKHSSNSKVRGNHYGVRDVADKNTINIQIDKKGKVVEDMLVEEGTYRAQGVELRIKA